MNKKPLKGTRRNHDGRQLYSVTAIVLLIIPIQQLYGKIPASSAVIKGLADDGGLYVPSYIPKLDKSVSSLVGKNYREIAFGLMFY